MRDAVRFVLLTAVFVGGLGLASSERAEAEVCEDCWKCTIRFAPDAYDCCPTSETGDKTCGVRSTDCTREITNAKNCNNSQGRCIGTSNSCGSDGGWGGGGGGGGCHIANGTLCPAECFNCTYFYY